MKLSPRRLASRRKAQEKYYANHRTQMIARAKKWAEDNYEKDKANRRKSNTKRYLVRRHTLVQKLYGLSPLAHQEMLTRQNFRCAFFHCGLEVDVYSPVDHDHNTGKARGILCHEHNLALGHFEKLNPECLLDAYAYLKGAAYRRERNTTGWDKGKYPTLFP